MPITLTVSKLACQSGSAKLTWPWGFPGVISKVVANIGSMFEFSSRLARKMSLETKKPTKQ